LLVDQPDPSAYVAGQLGDGAALITVFCPTYICLPENSSLVQKRLHARNKHENASMNKPHVFVQLVLG